MKLLNNISAFIVALIVLLSANGFIIEQYLCSGCHHKHSEIAFFEFGEISHNHSHCQSCEGFESNCSCHKDEHLKHSKILYFSLDQLYVNYYKINSPQITVSELPSFVINILLQTVEAIPIQNFFNSLLKQAPLIKTFAGSTDYSAVISTFRL